MDLLTEMASGLNRGCDALLRLFFLPFDDAWAAMLAASLATGLVIALLLRAFSNPRAIRQARDGCMAATLEMLLYRDDPVVQVRAFGRVLAMNLRYLLQALKPAAAAAVPAILIAVQVEGWLAVRPFDEGETGILKVRLSGGRDVMEAALSIKASDNLAVETPALRILAGNEVDWRFRVKREPDGNGWLEVGVDGTAMRQKVAVGRRVMRACGGSVRGAWNELRHPEAAVLPPGGEVDGVEVACPRREFRVGGWRVGGMGLFVGLSFAAAVAFRRAGGVRRAVSSPLRGQRWISCPPRS